MPADMATEFPSEIDALAPIRSELLGRPLEFIVAEHHRLRDLCRLLDGLVDVTDFGAATVTAVLHCIEHELPLHVIDEEEDLFPLIRRRAMPKDGVERLLGLLSREHVEDDRLARIIAHGLRTRGTAGWDEAAFRAALGSFSRRQRRHLAVENAVLIPLAELRLTARDREGLARRMAARRGVVLGPGHG
ncbi:hemerythrin domain-containing protein [Bosea thiooxidans]